MKTAMQELIDYFNERPEYDKTSEDYEIIEKAKHLLEKEKEHIMNFCWECLRGDNIHTITSNKELIEYINNKYNQTYNNEKD